MDLRSVQALCQGLDGNANNVPKLITVLSGSDNSEASFHHLMQKSFCLLVPPLLS